MKKVRKIFIFVLSFVLCALCISSSGYNVNAQELNTPDVSKEFVNYVTDSFLYKDKVTVINKEGIEITNEYFLNNDNFFKEKDFVSIKSYFEKNIDTICIDESFENKNARSPFVNQVVSKRYYKVLRKDQASGEIEYFLSGNFVWDRATNKITSIGNASINITVLNFGAGWEKHITSMSCGSKISTDKYYATFTGGFNLRVTFSRMNIIVFDVNFGRLTATATAHPEG